MREQRRNDLREAHRAEQRDAVAELIDAAPAWSILFETVVYGIAHLDDQTRVDRSGYAEARARLSKSLSVALLTVTEPDLHARVVRLREQYNRDDLIGPIVKARFAGTPVIAPRDRAAYVNQVTSEVNGIQAALAQCHRRSHDHSLIAPDRPDQPQTRRSEVRPH